VGVLALFFIKHEIETHYDVDNISTQRGELLWNCERGGPERYFKRKRDANAGHNQCGGQADRKGAPLPEVLPFESEPCPHGWRLVKNLDVYG
jgi:hypothetical protein